MNHAAGMWDDGGRLAAFLDVRIRLKEEIPIALKNEIPQLSFYRQRFDLRPILESASMVWRAEAARGHVHIDLIANASDAILWSNASSILRIVTRFVVEAIDASIAEGRIEVALRIAEPDSDWVVLSVQDWAGGRPDGWNLDRSTQTMAQLLEGHIDIANHPGRGTRCSLHLPTGRLEDWLERQSPSASGYYVALQSTPSMFEWSSGAQIAIDQAIQAELVQRGSFAPLSSQSYLLTTSEGVDSSHIAVAVAQRVARSEGLNRTESMMAAHAVRCDALGSMESFRTLLRRGIESPLSQPTTAREFRRAIPAPTRIDLAAAAEPRVKERLRPRRVFNPSASFHHR